MTRRTLSPGAAMARVMAAPAGPATADPIGPSETAAETAVPTLLELLRANAGRARAGRPEPRTEPYEPTDYPDELPVRLVDPDDLVTAAEIADRLRVTRSAVSQWHGRARVGFPEPVRYFGFGPRPSAVWLWSDVAAWARRHTAVSIRTVARRSLVRADGTVSGRAWE